MQKIKLEELYNSDSFYAEIVDDIQKINRKIDVKLLGDQKIKPYYLTKKGKKKSIKHYDGHVKGVKIKNLECFYFSVNYIINEEQDSIMCYIAIDDDENFYIVDNWTDVHRNRARLINNEKMLLLQEITILFNDYDK